MSLKILMNTAQPPPEVVKLISKNKKVRKHIEGWLAVPSITPPLVRLSRDELRRSRTMDDPSDLLKLLNDPIFSQTIGVLDLSTGCGMQCDTCLADAALPSRMFSLEWFRRFFKDKRSLRSLFPDYLRVGWTGDGLDHPDAIKIIKLILWHTRVLDQRLRRKTKGNNRHHVHVFTNYRPHMEGKLDELLALAKKHPSRLDVVISLPLNKNDSVNLAFNKYVKARPEVFGKQNKKYEDGLVDMRSYNYHLKNVGIQDVHHPGVLYNSGRVLPEEVARAKTDNLGFVTADRELGYKYRGVCEVYLNPDALWLLIYATMHESHTTFVYTPINKGNIRVFSCLPWRQFRKVPVNWNQNKIVEKSWKRIYYIRDSFKKAIRPVTVVKI